MLNAASHAACIFGRVGDDGALEERDRTEYSSRNAVEATVSRCDPGQREQIETRASQLVVPR